MTAWALLVFAAPAPVVVERPLIATWGMVDAARGVAFVRTQCGRDPARLSAIRLSTGKLLWTVRIQEYPLALYRGRPVVWEYVTAVKYRVTQLDPTTGKR